MSWLRRNRFEHELDRELRADLDLEAEEQQSCGLSTEQARHAAHRAFGNITLTKEEVRRMSGRTSFEILIQDLRYALRTLSKSPGFAATAILTLALGIGASTAIFTVIDTVLLQPLAYRDSGSLVVAWEHVLFLGGDATGPNPRHVDLWQKQATAFRGLTFLRQMAIGVTVGNEHPQMVGAVVSPPNLFDVLQVQPLLGRTFFPEDGAAGHEKVAILTYTLWQSLFHGDPGAIGKTIRVGDIARNIVGVLPPNFHFPNGNALRATRSRQPVSGAPEPALFYPAVLDMTQISWNGEYGNWIALGRLQPGVPLTQAAAQLNTIETRISEQLPGRRSDTLKASLQSMQEAVVGDSGTGLWLLMAAVIGLMLIACLNLANAQLGRALGRRREAAVRAALGAARWRLVWSALAENLVLALIGGAAGVLLASAGVDLFRRSSPIDLPRLSEVHLNLTALLFSLILTITASLLFGMLPALRMLAADPQTALQQGGNRAMGSRHSSRIRAGLIGLQVFGCTALLLITGLFSKSLLHLLKQDNGFETAQVIVAEIRLTPQNYGADQSRVAFDDAVLQNLRAIPGVRSAGLVSSMPLEGESWIESLQRVDRPEKEGPLINLRWVGPGYFETTGQRLVAGRFLEERDRNLSGAVISEGEAKAMWGEESPIDSRIQIEGRKFTVVGVVADSRNTSLKAPPAKMAYLHYKDRPPYPTFFLVRAARSADSLASSMRQAIWQYAPDITIARIKTLDAQLTDSLATERFQTFVLLSFGTAALLLAMLGIYGVLSYSVATRKQEIGVRMALGATRSSVYALALSEAGAPVVAGLATGLGASVLAGRLIQKLLYGVQVIDPPVILIVTGLFLVSATVAAFLPARRAASVNPMDALRSE